MLHDAHGLPAYEALPIVLARGANLVGEAKTIGPTLLFGAPATIPSELVLANLASGMNLYSADEVGAAGPAAKRNAFDRQVRLGEKHLGKQAPHFDLRCMAFDSDVIGGAAPAGLAVAANGVLERVSGA